MSTSHVSHPSYNVLGRVYGHQSDTDHQAPPAIRLPRPAASPRAQFSEDYSVTPGASWYLPLKHGGDFVSAIILLILSAPMMLIGAILVKLTSRGPAFYRQVRLGKDGRPFTLLKLRTMKNDAEAQTGPVWSTANDNRITPLGQLLRRTHIDEFPQLLNVIRGEMSLVGPRPERPEFVAKLDWEIPYYRERLKVRPGITGLAQMRLDADSSLDSVQRKVVHDVYYVRHVNPALDVKLLFLTGWRLIKELSLFVYKCFVLPSHEEIERGFHQAVGIVDDEPAVSHVALMSISTATQANQTEKVEYRDLAE